MSSQITLYVSNDNLVQNPTPMRRASNGAYVNDASVTMTLKDSAGAAVTGATSLTLSYVTDSNGIYAGTIGHGVALVAGDVYTLEITGTSGSEYAFWSLSCNAINRTS